MRVRSPSCPTLRNWPNLQDGTRPSETAMGPAPPEPQALRRPLTGTRAPGGPAFGLLRPRVSLALLSSCLPLTQKHPPANPIVSPTDRLPLPPPPPCPHRPAPAQAQISHLGSLNLSDILPPRLRESRFSKRELPYPAPASRSGVSRHRRATHFRESAVFF